MGFHEDKRRGGLKAFTKAEWLAMGWTFRTRCVSTSLERKSELLPILRSSRRTHRELGKGNTFRARKDRFFRE